VESIRRWARARRWGLRLLAAGALALAGLSVSTPSLLSVSQPQHGAVVGIDGVVGVVRFPDGDRVAEETFRVLLNGSDVTEAFTTGSNGAYGRLHALLDGENVLRFEVFGRRWWLPGLLLEEAREVRFTYRPPQYLDRG
jgi:hypothetical protein